MKADIAQLQKQQLYLGTSSWKYEGWKGLVYKRPYKTTKEFNEKCLEEYAELFSTVGIDHTYYAWPSPKMFEKYLAQTPPTFRFGLKVTEKITVFKYPTLKRYGKDAGKVNPLFLDPVAFREEFLTPLLPFKDRIGPLMLEFSQFHPGSIGSGHEFVERLDKFFSEVRAEGFQLAVEIRNANWLKTPYFQVLVKHGVTHVFNSWTRMPLLQEQLLAAKEFKFPCFVSRLLLNPGVAYENAVEAYSPYDKLFEQHLDLRIAAASLLQSALDAGVPAYVFVNNRFEGCAPLTIESILDIFLKRDHKKSAGF
jgi:uncharacterized protein YecE (DUF72 family)